MSATASPTDVVSLPATSNSSGGTFYFSYGSNMWLDQVARRCPYSKFLGIARIPGYQWIINARGSANIVQIPTSHDERRTVAQQPLKDSTSDSVWGLVYYLAPSDEVYLDTREHVPVNFTKEVISTQFWPGENTFEVPFGAATEHRIDVAKSPETLDMLVYINRTRTVPDLPRDEYIVRMNEGITDALKIGVPEEYVDKVLRKFIPKSV